MAKSCTISVICLVMLVILVKYGSCQCVNAETSEGFVTLQEGQKACAPLQSGETQNDNGKRFLTCNNGNLAVQSCPPGLRFDTNTDGCNWAQLATCQLAGANIQSTSGITSANETGTITSQTPATVVTLSHDVCNSTSCMLPKCFCYGASYTAIAQKDIPQFIMLTFDDAITAALYQQYYGPLLIDNIYNIYNPNGCKINAAMYVSHDNTDYTFLQILANAGNEIASHTIHHILPEGDNPGDYENMSAEISGMRDVILQKTGNKNLADSIVGFRAPYLKVAGDTMFQVLLDNRFLYDTSIVNVETTMGRLPLWPFTLDFLVKSCVNPPCPSKPFSGLWEIPLNTWTGDDGYGCSMIDGCSVAGNVFTATEQDWYNYYQRNFQNYFYKKRVPMHFFTHASMFLRSPASFPALVRWIKDTLSTYPDVWIVNPRQVIEWMKQPKVNADMIVNKWSCNGV